MKNEEYKHKYRKIRRIQTLKKLLVLQNTFREMFPHQNERSLRMMLSQCSKEHLNIKKKHLSDDTRAMYEYLLRNNYNPSTVYKWFLLFISEETIPEEIEKLSITTEKVQRTKKRRKTQEILANNWKFLEEAKLAAQEMMSILDWLLRDRVYERRQKGPWQYTGLQKNCEKIKLLGSLSNDSSHS